MKISKSQWQDLEPLLDIGMEMPADARRAWLDALPETEPSAKRLIPQLRALFAAHDTAERLLEFNTLAKEMAPPVDSSPIFSEGDTIGGYRLIRLIGRGGMGEVWLADQVDGRVERQVALKLPTLTQRIDIWRQRFQRERNILARLAHPGIARLLDAGVEERITRAGYEQPYLVIEYIEGQSLSAFADERALDLTARLKLFRQVLAATIYAHRQLIVHRDLKPGNILVTPSGEVKLLDFGIAKLTQPSDITAIAGTSTNASTTATSPTSAGVGSATDFTELAGRAMTLRYAAPEQAEGEIVSTSFDVYALGVILHELVTGLSPYEAVRAGKRFTQSALAKAVVSVPSTLSLRDQDALERGLKTSRQLAKAISGDLDAIILKALRANPSERYESATAMDEDIARALEGTPVRARKGTVRYLVSRFVRRNRVWVVATNVAVVALLTGVVVIEKERREANKQRERAERHFQAVRSLSNSLLLDVHDSIKGLSGSLNARKSIAEKASQYLATVADDGEVSEELRVELAEAYRRLGNIQGQPGDANIGEIDQAMASYLRAVQLVKRFAPDMKRTDMLQRRALRSLREAWRALFYLQRDQRKDHDALESASEAAQAAARLAAMPDAPLDDRLNAAKIGYERERARAAVASTMDEARAIRISGVEAARGEVEKINQEIPNNDLVLEDLAWLRSENGHAIRGSSDPAVKRRAIEHYLNALRIREQRHERSPNDQVPLRAIVAHHNALSIVHEALGDLPAATEHALNSLARVEQLVALEPASAQFRLDLAYVLERVAQTQSKQRLWPEAEASLSRAIAIFQKLPVAMQGGGTQRKGYLGFLDTMCRVLEEQVRAPGVAVATRQAINRKLRATSEALAADATDYLKKFPRDKEVFAYKEAAERRLTAL